MLNIFRNKDKELERAKTKLISDLENNGIDFLIEQMSNGEIYSTLLDEKRKSEISGTDYISWYAYRHAEKLHKPADKEQLLKMLSLGISNNIKKHIYFCLAHLCRNTSDKQLFNFLMNRLAIEDNECKLVILIGIAQMEKSADLNIEPIKELTNVKSRDLRVHSILALKHTHDSEVETILLSLFQNSKDSHRKSIICDTLATVGSVRSLSILEFEYKKTRDFSLRYNIEQTVASIKKLESGGH
jgi:hypothetical protein